MDVVLGNGDGTAEGRFTVSEAEGEYTIRDPFTQVVFPDISRVEIQVNDRVVERRPDLGGSTWDQSRYQTYHLLPGLYRFYGGEPVGLFDPESVDAAIEVAAPPAEPTPAQVEAVQAAVNERVDACVEYRLTAPPGCPFATDGQVDTVDRERVDRVEDLVWTVLEYPKTTVTQGIDVYGQPALLVDFIEPGRLELQGQGTTDNEHWKAFTAMCRFGGAELAVLLRGEDSIELAPLGQPETDTCRGTA